MISRQHDVIHVAATVLPRAVSPLCALTAHVLVTGLHLMRRIGRLLTLAALLLVVLLAVAGPSVAEPLTVTIVHVNDWDRMDGVDGRGGAAKIAAVVTEERTRAEQEGGVVIVTFGGDMISPSLLSGIDKGDHMIELANTIGFDLAVLGNHEFDFGPDILKQRLKQSDTVWLAGNVRYRGQPGFPGAEITTIVEYGGYRIGFLGLVTPSTEMISSPGEDVTFAPFVETGTALAEELKETGVDYVIALTHNVLAQDLELLRTTDSINALLGGHDHLAVAWYDGKQTILKAGSQGSYVGVLRLKFDRVTDQQGNSRLLWTPDYALRATEDVKGEPELVSAIERLHKQIDHNFDIPVGKTASELDTRHASMRSSENAFGNLVTDAMRTAVAADIALTNSGGFRGDTIYPAGSDITGKLMLTELPFGDKTVVLALSGVQIRQALEHGVGNLESSGGSFPQVSGLIFSFDASKPQGRRVIDVFVDGAALEDSRIYTFATNDYLANGGDRYTLFKRAERLISEKDAALVVTQVLEYVEAAGIVSPTIEGRVVRLDRQ